MFNRELIKKIIYATGIKKSDVVLIQFWGDDCDREVLHNFSYEIAALGASPFELQQSRSINASLFANVSEDNFDEKYFKIFSSVDVIIDLFMYKPVVPSPELPKEKFEFYRKYMGNLFKAFADKKKFIQIRVPTKENSEESSLDPEKYIKLMNAAYDIDYDELKMTCENKLTEIKDKTRITIKTGSNNILNLSIKDRKWFVDAGDGDFPCGEIYIAPVETETNGSIFFKEIYLEDDELIHDTDVTLKIVNGKITESSSTLVSDYLKNLPENGDIIGEFGLGLNKNVTSLTGYSVLDEKMYGTFHLGLGTNVQFGGTITSPVHMDLVTTGDVFFN